MQTLIIEKLRFANGVAIKTDFITSILKTRLAKEGIKTGDIKFNESSITLSSKDKLFTSATENHIILNETDPRIRTLGRKFLLSKRLNESQYKALFLILKEPFDDLGILCDIIFKDDVKTEKWRTDLITTFPIINTKLLPKKAEKV